MKPQKNIVYCAATRRKKMIFETKAKADNFILYNKDEIEEENGKAPVRSYYCRICGGYHVTSNPSKRDADRFDRMDEKLAKVTDEKIKTNYDIGPLLEEIEKKRVEVEVYIAQGRFSLAEQILTECRKELALFRHSLGNTHAKWLRWDTKLESILHDINEIRIIENGKPEELRTFLAKENKTQKELDICNALLNHKYLNEVKELLKEIDMDLNNKNVDAKEKLKECRKTLKQIVCPYKKELFKEIRKEIEEREQKAIQLFPVPRNEKKENKYFVRGKDDYKRAILYLIEKLEELNKVYNDGDIDECLNILEIIAFGLNELREDKNTTIIRAQYEKWLSKFEADKHSII